MYRIEIIRQKYANGTPITQICREENVDYKTAKKYIDKEDFSEELPVKRQKAKLIDDYQEEIINLLTDNKPLWHKQRLTSKRIYDLLKEKHEDFSISYDSVNRFVQNWKKNQKKNSEPGYSHLVWYPGEAQADFGEADIEYYRILTRYKYFVLSFPHANVAYAQFFRGENCECVCQGLEDIFQYIGGVPFKIVFDNATGIGRVVCKVLEENEMFQRFRLHYNFKSRFCNPNAGHEKGSVEANVGFIRRNALTPPLKISESIQGFNSGKMFKLCQDLMDKRIHYIHKIPVMKLFEEDRKALLPLPVKPFAARRIQSMKTDNYANVTLENVHKYTLSPEYRNEEVLVETWAWTVKVFTPDGKKIDEFERIYGKERSESINPSTGIVSLCRKPGMWSNSQFRARLPVENPFRNYVDSINEADVKHKIFYEFNRAMNDFSYEIVLEAFSEMAERKIDMTVRSDVAAVCSRISSCPIDYSYNPTGVDLEKYAVLMNQEQTYGN